MRAIISVAVSLLAALATAAPMSQLTRLDTLAKRNFVAALTPRLSNGSTVSFPEDSHWRNITERWDQYLAPTFRAAVQVGNEQDIVAVVQYARAHNITFFTQGGGHGFAPLNRVQNAIMIQMRNLNSVSVDPQTGVATVGGGTEYIEVIDALYAAGREYTVGSCPCVGMTGAGLGGGIGRLQGLHGLSIDAFQRYRVVLANSSVINVSRTENPDLFWGMRGAGHNFGIVVQSEVQTFAQHSGGLYYNVDFNVPDNQLEAAFTIMNQQIATMPPELAVEPAFVVDPATLKTTFTVNMVYSGNTTAGQVWSNPWRALNPTNFTESTVTWADLPTKTEGGSKNVDCISGGFKNIYSANLATFDIPTMRAVYNNFSRFILDHPNANASTILFEVYSQQGVRAPPADDSAFAFRNTMAILPLIFGWWDDPSLTPTIDAFLSNTRSQLAAVSGYDNLNLYQNYANTEPLQAIYGYEPWRLERLQELKRKYDPSNQFFGYHPIPF